MLFAADPWFRGIDLSYGPDGSVFILDWSDTGECHEHDGVHRTSGRIYKVTYGESPQRAASTTIAEARRDSSWPPFTVIPNEWFVRQARRVLANRAARGEPLERSQEALARSVRRTTPTRAQAPRTLVALCDRRHRRRIPSPLCSITTTNPSGRGPFAC